MQKTWVRSLGREDPLEKDMATHCSILAWRIPGQRSLVGYSPWGRKGSDTTEWFRFHFMLKYNSLDIYEGKFVHITHVHIWVTFFSDYVCVKGDRQALNTEPGMGWLLRNYSVSCPFPQVSPVPPVGMFSIRCLTYVRASFTVLCPLPHLRASTQLPNVGLWSHCKPSSTIKRCKNNTLNLTFSPRVEEIALISHTSKVILKILQARLQQYVNHELPDRCSSWI